MEIHFKRATGPTLFEVQAKWVLRNPTQFAFLKARNSWAAQLSSNQAFSFNISKLRKEMLTFNTQAIQFHFYNKYVTFIIIIKLKFLSFHKYGVLRNSVFVNKPDIH